MPKRDIAYMNTQREMLAQAALECLLERGLGETSIRDICAQAGVSTGAFYVHFNDKEEVILAACEIDLAQEDTSACAQSWDEYRAIFMAAPAAFDKTRARKRLRMSYQFAAELTLYDRDLPGFKSIHDRYYTWIRESLRCIHANGEIGLPLGLEQTAMLHARLYYGTIHIMTVNHSFDRHELFAELVRGMALIADLKPGAG